MSAVSSEALALQLQDDVPGFRAKAQSQSEKLSSMATFGLDLLMSMKELIREEVMLDKLRTSQKYFLVGVTGKWFSIEVCEGGDSWCYITNGVRSYAVQLVCLASWHAEDHDLHSLNYLHMGQARLGMACRGMPLSHLKKWSEFMGVPCCRLVLNAGEFVDTFPIAYHTCQQVAFIDA